MKYYWIKTHPLVRRLFSNYVWKIPTTDKVVYLTFDDGPTPEITQWVLSQLKDYDFKATFFCIGNNVVNHPEILSAVKAAGHSIGNHTYDHVNEWHVDLTSYIKNVEACLIELKQHDSGSLLFRPPYGKLTRKQSAAVRKIGYKVIMWDILSADFDRNVSPEQCLKNVISNISPGSIIIFHDSQKAFTNLKTALPGTLKFLKEKGYRSAAL